jgi:hypothetical protein
MLRKSHVLMVRAAPPRDLSLRSLDRNEHIHDHFVRCRPKGETPPRRLSYL